MQQTGAIIEVLKRRRGVSRFAFVSEGTSMYPIVKAGNVLSVQTVPYEALEVGDIVVFRRQDQLVGHRLMLKEADAFQTRGDALRSRDRRASVEDYVGRVESVQKGGSGKADLKDEAAIRRRWREGKSKLTRWMMVKMEPWPQRVCWVLARIAMLFERRK